MNGLERMWYCENSLGRVFLTSPQSPIPKGYQRKSTTIPAEMDKLFAKLDEQTKIEHGALTMDDYNRRRERIDQWRSDIRGRMISSDCGDFEREVLRVALKSCDEREAKLNRNSVYGVSAMQQSPAPIERRVEVTIPTTPSNEVSQ